jgi:hypothetical protein
VLLVEVEVADVEAVVGPVLRSFNVRAGCRSGSVCACWNAERATPARLPLASRLSQDTGDGLDASMHPMMRWCVDCAANASGRQGGE